MVQDSAYQIKVDPQPDKHTATYILFIHSYVLRLDTYDNTSWFCLTILEDAVYLVLEGTSITLM